jgi:hypothetical protein
MLVVMFRAKKNRGRRHPRFFGIAQNKKGGNTPFSVPTLD